VCPNPYQADIPQDTVVDEAFNFLCVRIVPVSTCLPASGAGPQSLAG